MATLNEVADLFDRFVKKDVSDPDITKMNGLMDNALEIVKRVREYTTAIDIETYQKYVKSGMAPELAAQLLITNKGMINSQIDKISTALKEGISKAAMLMEMSTRKTAQ